MDWLGSGLVSDLLGVGSGLFGSLFGQSSAEDAAETAFQHQRALMDHQYELQTRIMQNKHFWESQDLAKAGFNPLLSVTQPSGTLGVSSAPGVNMAQPAQSAAAMANAFSGAFANMKNAQANMINAKANSVKAEADMITAQNDTNRTNFMMGPEFELKTQITNAQMDNLIANSGLANSQAALNLLQKEWLPKLMEANLNEIQMKIATGYLVARAQDYALRTSADAQMVSAHAATISANAHVMQGQAALSQAASYDRFVANVEMLGVHEANLKDWQSKVAIETANNLLSKTEAKRRENRYESEFEDDWLYRESLYEGRVVGNMADFFNSATRFVNH